MKKNKLAVKPSSSRSADQSGAELHLMAPVRRRGNKGLSEEQLAPCE